MLGRTRAEVQATRQGWEELVHPKDLARVLAAHDAHIAGHTAGYEAQYRLRHRDGHWVWVLDRGRVVERDAAGVALRMVGTHLDVTARVESEQALRRSEEALRMASRLARLGSWRYEVASQQLTVVLGIGQAGAVQSTLHSLESALERVTPGHRNRLRERLHRALADGEPFQDEVDTGFPSRPRRRLLVLAEAVRDRSGAIVALQGALQDVTQAHQAAQQLRLLEAAVSAIDDMILITEAEPAAEPGPPIVFANDAFERVTGWRRADVLGRSPRFLMGPATDALELKRVELALQRGQAVRSALQTYTRSGQIRWVDIALAPVRDGAGRITHVISVHRDMSERQRADAAVSSAQEELAATLSAVPDLLFDLDLDGLIHGYHSPRSELLPALPEHLIGRRADEVLPRAAAAVVNTALLEAQKLGYSSGLQYELQLTQGSRWFELSVAPKPSAAGKLPRFIALARDITERLQAETDRRTLERQLREAQKIESIGTLAGGIAHDFNNILAAILGNVALARGELPPDHGAQLSLEQIHKASLRARSLVQQILAFSRRQLNPLLAQALRPVVEETLALLRATLPAAVRVDTDMADEALWIQADATQIQQVLMNLCTNAWHALPEGRGHIQLGFRCLEAAAPERPEDLDLAPGPAAHLWVRDDGCGMDAPTLERVFDPFFTTKPVGQGTGLGLSVVHGIVRSHGGIVRVQSTLGKGSTFHVYLPMAQPPCIAAGAEAGRPAAASKGIGQHVLYVDDDEVMLLMVQRLLEREGYEVSVCDSAARALEALHAEPGRFDLVVSDFNMPEVSGVELARQIARLRPGLPVIISSGFVTDELHAAAAAVGVRALMYKEQTLEELPRLVQSLLQGGSAPIAPPRQL
jgi:PAS domain S-box-containing protein